ncbi:MAG: hypothetical protein Q9186_000596 [Xanthomendoza sp. 1 TL-2023]
MGPCPATLRCSEERVGTEISTMLCLVVVDVRRAHGPSAFRNRKQAEKALSNMDGEWLGSRAIRCNGANIRKDSRPFLSNKHSEF